MSFSEKSLAFANVSLFGRLQTHVSMAIVLVPLKRMWSSLLPFSLLPFSSSQSFDIYVLRLVPDISISKHNQFMNAYSFIDVVCAREHTRFIFTYTTFYLLPSHIYLLADLGGFALDISPFFSLFLFSSFVCDWPRRKLLYVRTKRIKQQQRRNRTRNNDNNATSHSFK